MKNIMCVCLVMMILILPCYSFSFSESFNVVDPKTLAFPVAGKKATVGSFWGAVRDGGKRKHEGIDIFARKGTAVVAVSDGFVEAVGNGGRGGKTVWLRSSDYGWTEYYAHLDQQKVKRGQWVKKGQVIGTVGNTGNAKFTPPHLHFGIYTSKGAVNPLPYVKTSPRIIIPADPAPKKEMLAQKTTPALPSSPIAEKYIAKKLNVSADPSGKYYVTVRRNVVRVYQNKLVVIGKWLSGKNSKYPHRIVLANNQQLFITGKGAIMTAKGIKIGTVS